jgi:hypothetical protein
VAQYEVHLVSRSASGVRRKAGPREQALGNAMMSTVLFETGVSAVREPALTTEAGDQAELFERSEVRERGRRSYPEPGGDVLEARALSVGLAGGDDPQSFDLSMRELLEGLHGRGRIAGVYIRYPNY